jgi:hypothetical protein
LKTPRHFTVFHIMEYESIHPSEVDTTLFTPLSTSKETIPPAGSHNNNNHDPHMVQQIGALMITIDGNALIGNHRELLWTNVILGSPKEKERNDHDTIARLIDEQGFGAIKLLSSNHRCMVDVDEKFFKSRLYLHEAQVDLTQLQAKLRTSTTTTPFTSVALVPIFDLFTAATAYHKASSPGRKPATLASIQGNKSLSATLCRQLATLPRTPEIERLLRIPKACFDTLDAWSLEKGRQLSSSSSSSKSEPSSSQTTEKDARLAKLRKSLSQSLTPRPRPAPVQTKFENGQRYHIPMTDAKTLGVDSPLPVSSLVSIESLICFCFFFETKKGIDQGDQQPRLTWPLLEQQQQQSTTHDSTPHPSPRAKQRTQICTGHAGSATASTLFRSNSNTSQDIFQWS